MNKQEMKVLDRNREAMEAFSAGGEVEYIIKSDDYDDEWSIWKEPDWDCSYYSFRIRKTPRECWRNEYPNGRLSNLYSTKDDAMTAAGDGAKQIKFIEVMEDE